jgi:hypothetical protein
MSVSGQTVWITLWEQGDGGKLSQQQDYGSASSDTSDHVAHVDDLLASHKQQLSHEPSLDVVFNAVIPPTWWCDSDTDMFESSPMLGEFRRWAFFAWVQSHSDQRILIGCTAKLAKLIVGRDMAPGERAQISIPRVVVRPRQIAVVVLGAQLLPDGSMTEV